MDEFFITGDGLTETGVLSSTNQSISGFYDVISSDVFIDDGPAGTRAEFVCSITGLTKSIVGNTLTVDEISYRITGYQPDGSGLVTLTLFDED